MISGAVCVFSPLAAFVVGIPVVGLLAVLWKSAPTTIFEVLFGIGGALAGALAGRVMLTQFQSEQAAEAKISGSPTLQDGPRGSDVSVTQSAAQGEIHYDAFVSYRGILPDMACARWLQGRLESYRTPKSLVRSRQVRRRLLPVFLDQNELPASADLGGAIRRALEMSRFLIVVSSPRTPISEYISEEVSYFIKLGRRKEILFCLIEGELRDTLPPSTARPRE